MTEDIEISKPTIADGSAMWRLAGAAGELDVNSSYSYLLWCRDFAFTSVVARVRGDAHLAGFITGYRRPDDPSVLLVWQVAVSEHFRRMGLAGRMLEELVYVLRAFGGTHIETTVTPDNGPSRAMFSALARREGTELVESSIFEVSDFPDVHEPERLIRIGPID